MTVLPSALARWREQLQLFPDDLATLLGQLVLRLSPAFDGFVSHQDQADGDVDGFDGIANRGNYERLLASEWMLQRGAPLEFLRRAASGEQAFFRLALKQPAAPEATLAIFDAGPDQLGGCRLAQLALLVLLVQRAENRGQALRWQLLHHIGEGLHSGLDERVVRAFLHGRIGMRSTSATVDAWAEQAGRHRLWLVGPRAITSLGRAAFARITLSERIASDAEVVDVTLESKARTRRAALALPTTAEAARLLRDPFDQPRTAPSFQVTSNLLLNPRGNRVFYRDARGDLIVVPISHPRTDAVGKPRRHRATEAGALIGGVGGKGRKLIWLEHHQGLLRVGFADHSSRKKKQLLAPGPPLNRLAPVAWFPGEEMATFEAADNSLWHADFRTGKSRQIAEGVRSWLLLRDRTLVAVDHWLEAKGQAGVGDRCCVLELKPYKALPFVAAPLPWNQAWLSTCDVAETSFTLGFEEAGVCQLQEWRYYHEPTPRLGQQRTTLHVPPDASVIGVEPFSPQQARPGLWLLEGDRHEVSIVRINSTRSVFKTSASIEQVHVASSAHVLAVSTSDRELYVVDAGGHVLYQGSAHP